MTQNCLVNLSILSIEKEIAADIDLTSVVCEFAEAKLEGLNFKISCFTVIHKRNCESLVESFNVV